MQITVPKHWQCRSRIGKHMIIIWSENIKCKASSIAWLAAVSFVFSPRNVGWLAHLKACHTFAASGEGFDYICFCELVVAHRCGRLRAACDLEQTETCFFN